VATLTVADLRSVLLEGLNSPLGMAFVGDGLHVAHADAVLRSPCLSGKTRITAPRVKVVKQGALRVDDEVGHLIWRVTGAR